MSHHNISNRTYNRFCKFLGITNQHFFASYTSYAFLYIISKYINATILDVPWKWNDYILIRLYDGFRGYIWFIH